MYYIIKYTGISRENYGKKTAVTLHLSIHVQMQDCPPKNKGP